MENLAAGSYKLSIEDSYSPQYYELIDCIINGLSDCWGYSCIDWSFYWHQETSQILSTILYSCKVFSS